MKACLLLLGSNVGDRQNHLFWAIRNLPRCTVLARSRIYETAPEGPRQRNFLNLAVNIRTDLSPMGLLAELKRLEAIDGRRPGPRWGPRPLDIDIISYGSKRIKTRWLTVPHPLTAKRAFALAPLSDIAPGFKPDGKHAVSALLRRLNPGPETVRIYVDDR